MIRIQSLSLFGFRTYLNHQFIFDQKVTALVGPNAIGKTNVLEAIYLLATGTSFRADKVEEMINFGEEYARVEAKLAEADAETVGVLLTRGVVQGRRASKRRYFVNGVPRRRSDFSGTLTAVLFSPEDLELLVGSPGKRRRFLDQVLVQARPHYARSLALYEKALVRRNKLLDLVREGQAPQTALTFWDQTLVREGEVIQRVRQEFVDAVNGSRELAARRLVLYAPSVISEARLAEHRAAEIAVGYTLVGPHKDDFRVVSLETARKRDLATFGSRGEQRMAVLWLKLASLTYLEQSSNSKPLLLLDDIFSELDEMHSERVWEIVEQQQTILTATEVPERGEIKLISLLDK